MAVEDELLACRQKLAQAAMAIPQGLMPSWVLAERDGVYLGLIGFAYRELLAHDQHQLAAELLAEAARVTDLPAPVLLARFNREGANP